MKKFFLNTYFVYPGINKIQLRIKPESDLTDCVKRSRISTVIFAQPDLLARGLLPFLRSFDLIEPIGAYDKMPDFLVAVRTLKPDLAILSCTLVANEDWLFLKEIKNQCPSVICMAFVETLQQHELARLAGIDFVLISGFSANEFAQEVIPRLRAIILNKNPLQ